MRRELLLLREMRDAAVAIQDSVGDRSAEQVDADALRRSALLWHFTVLGEAASQVPSDTKDSYPKIAWRAATRLRNRIVHGYWNIDIDTLVATAADDLTEMVARLDGAITASQEREDSGPTSDAATGNPMDS
ncbi:MAG: HepT-like ribonuclease domain-containing protein [Phycicoccus sp.]